MSAGWPLTGQKLASQVLNAIAHPVIMLDADDRIIFANAGAEDFFLTSQAILLRQTLAQIVPFASPVLTLVAQVRARSAAVNEYGVDLSSPRLGGEKIADIYGTPSQDMPGAVVLMLQERGVADKIARQLGSRNSARSVAAMAAMLAHEIKTPLSGIRGAAQLLDHGSRDEDRPLTRLIMDETDRIVTLVDRWEAFSESGLTHCEPLNIHNILDHVCVVAASGFARHVTFSAFYDPSLPPVYGNRDQLVQVFMNLIKNASEAIVNEDNPTIKISTAYRPGVRITLPRQEERTPLPLEFTVADNGPGVPDDIRQIIFDPFITTKPNGTGLGLPLVAKIIAAHGGVIECDRPARGAAFRILMPAVTGEEAGFGTGNMHGVGL